MTDDEFRAIQVRLMQTQTDLYAKQARWETLRALATIIAGVAVFGGLVIAVSNWMASRQPPPAAPVTVYQLPPGTTITTPARP